MIVLATFVVLSSLVDGFELDCCCREALFRRCGRDDSKNQRSIVGIKQVSPCLEAGEHFAMVMLPKKLAYVTNFSRP